MAEAPENVPEDSEVTEQIGEKATDPAADLQQKKQMKGEAIHKESHQSEARAVSSKKKKREKAANKKSSDEKSAVPMSNVKNLQELLNKLSNMPSSLTTGSSETDGPSKGHEFWDTQPVPKLGMPLNSILM